MNAQLGPLRALLVLATYRNRLFDGVVQDIRQRYVGSALGIAWAVLFPAMQLSIYAGLYTIVFKIKPPDLNTWAYVVLVFAGMIPLMAFNEALTASTNSLSSSKSLLLNTIFPAELIPIRAALAAHVPSIAGLFITLTAALIIGRASWLAVALIPFLWILVLMFATGLGWILSLLSLVVRDIQHGLGIIIMLLFMLSPFAYTPAMMPEGLRPIIYFNPLSYFVLCFQQVICYDRLPDVRTAVGAVALAFITFFIGFTFFRRTKNVFFDYA